MADPVAQNAAENIVTELAEVESIAIRFAGDSGDGSQLIGGEFANTSAIVGNDISTLPDFPAEIRAPVGTLPGVSGFQVHIAERTPSSSDSGNSVDRSARPAVPGNLSTNNSGGSLS